MNAQTLARAIGGVLAAGLGLFPLTFSAPAR